MGRDISENARERADAQRVVGRDRHVVFAALVVSRTWLPVYRVTPYPTL